MAVFFDELFPVAYICESCKSSVPPAKLLAVCPVALDLKEHLMNRRGKDIHKELMSSATSTRYFQEKLLAVIDDDTPNGSGDCRQEVFEMLQNTLIHVSATFHMPCSKSQYPINARCQSAILPAKDSLFKSQKIHLLHVPTPSSLAEADNAWKSQGEYLDRKKCNAYIHRDYDAMASLTSPEAEHPTVFATRPSIGTNFAQPSCDKKSSQKSLNLSFSKSVIPSLSAFDELLGTESQEHPRASPRAVRHIEYGLDYSVDESEHQIFSKVSVANNSAPSKKSDLLQAIESIERYQFAAFEAKQALNVVSFAPSLENYRLQLLENELQVLKDQLDLQKQHITYLQQERMSLLRDRSELMKCLERHNFIFNGTFTSKTKVIVKI